MKETEIEKRDYDKERQELLLRNELIVRQIKQKFLEWEALAGGFGNSGIKY